MDLELPLGKRSTKYRLFEILPGSMSYGMVLILVILSLIDPLWAAAYLLLLILTLFTKSVGIAVHTIIGHRKLVQAQKIDWHDRLAELESPNLDHYLGTNGTKPEHGQREHIQNLEAIIANPELYPKPSALYHLVIMASYNEDYEILKTTVDSVIDSTYDKSRIIFCLAYEERGGLAMSEAASKLRREYKGAFHSFHTIMHPKNLPDEVVGKGPNITYSAQEMQKYLDREKIPYRDVIVTTLDCDNRPHKTYFDYVSYEYIVQPNRKRLSYQPIALYFGNIWDAPAPMRVIATGNSFWTIISSMRPHTLRNFAAHSQPMDALVEMGFWSKRSIVEDGHQYWRSYFYFDGDYEVVPIHVPIYQDAVMAETLKKTLVAQFKQLRRWGYGASDIPYVAVRLFSWSRNVPLTEGLARFIRLIDGHVTLATTALLVTFGGWVPLLINPEASRNIAAHSLPEVVSIIQRVAMIGIFITILLMLKMLPPRPARYKRRRTVGMVLQWLLMPVTAVCYSAMASFNAQTHLMFGKYLDKFDVTEKATYSTRERAKQDKLADK